MQRAQAIRGNAMTLTTRGYIVLITGVLLVVGFAGWVEGL